MFLFLFSAMVAVRGEISFDDSDFASSGERRRAGPVIYEGYCVTKHGNEQTAGVVQLDNVDTNQECINQCLAYDGFWTGCEIVYWDTARRLAGCYVHTAQVARGNGVDGHVCWVNPDQPTDQPSRAPTFFETPEPTSEPTDMPTGMPTSKPTRSLRGQSVDGASEKEDEDKNRMTLVLEIVTIGCMSCLAGLVLCWLTGSDGYSKVTDFVRRLTTFDTNSRKSLHEKDLEAVTEIDEELGATEDVETGNTSGLVLPVATDRSEAFVSP